MQQSIRATNSGSLYGIADNSLLLSWQCTHLDTLKCLTLNTIYLSHLLAINLNPNLSQLSVQCTGQYRQSYATLDVDLRILHWSS